VIIERTWFQSPETITSKMWTSANATRSHAATKWMVLADWRPPKKSTQPGMIESSHGDIAKPISTTRGSSTKITERYASFCSTL
jgi:hypothetical protein